jgi:hypothetical protein
VINQKEKEEKFQAIIKDKSLKEFYGKPYEHKYNNLDGKSDMRTINQSSDIDGSGVAAEDENLNSVQIPRQNPAVECNQSLVNGTTSLISGEGRKNNTEEVISVKFLVLFIISEKFSHSFRKVLRKNLN